MKIFIQILILICPLLAWNQHVYDSPVTQTWPSIFKSNYQEIKRTIAIEENAIILSTENSKGKEFEILYIRKIERSNEEIIYKCRTSGNKDATVIIPAVGTVNRIDLYKASAKTGEEIQYRFHIF
ncbi:hypothetical protein [Salinimicrobium sp. GXAS 041]|uniref:hypothetical protein n=1 Tax=Salinimicrobium sp. GXAS 041 TaxID=3400806 RepID=UPI003C74747C